MSHWFVVLLRTFVCIGAGEQIREGRALGHALGLSLSKSRPAESSWAAADEENACARLAGARWLGAGAPRDVCNSYAERVQPLTCAAHHRAQMSDSDDYDAADSGAADCTPVAAGDARKGGFLLIKGKPCKIVDVSKAKVGKHGAAKCHFIGVDIFTGKKLESICPASASLSQPIVERIEYQLCDVADDGFLSLMAKDNSMRDDVKLPDDEAVAKKIQEAWDTGDEYLITVQKAVGIEQAIEVKKAAN